jgi:hypothetical protein
VDIQAIRGSAVIHLFPATQDTVAQAYQDTLVIAASPGIHLSPGIVVSPATAQSLVTLVTLVTQDQAAIQVTRAAVSLDTVDIPEFRVTLQSAGIVGIRVSPVTHLTPVIQVILGQALQDTLAIPERVATPLFPGTPGTHQPLVIPVSAVTAQRPVTPGTAPFPVTQVIRARG